jgi:hypothetical protein
MEQLYPLKTIVISGHGTNTVDKKLVSMEMLIELNTPTLILEYIPLPILLKMEKLFDM